MENLSNVNELGASPEEIDTVQGALNDPEWDFRTAAGIERETGIDKETVAAILDQSGIARLSAFRALNKESLYAPVDRKKSFREYAEEIRRTLAHDF